jgi:hypothetical protein
MVPDVSKLHGAFISKGDAFQEAVAAGLYVTEMFIYSNRFLSCFSVWCLRFEVSTTVNVQITAFRDVTPCDWEDWYQPFGGTSYPLFVGVTVSLDVIGS